MPVDAYVNLPGSARASVTNSWIVLALKFLFDTMTRSIRASGPTGLKSRSASNGSFEYSTGEIENWMSLPSRTV
ncbi:MAG: hypothetical protein NTV56_22430 [Alphaproteobacteria bacterium]|nr:hypothetical protein [Alphaproteobacteria bacterium]